MAINSNHLVGFAVGLGTAAVGIYLYKRNQARIDGWLREQGINIPLSAGNDYAAMSLEELVLEKERLEDLIAEREMATPAKLKTEEKKK
jgi:hypothetical protein